MQHPFTNELIHESSVYLLQHAHNPVNWFPWGEAAFQKASQENKPILISIGYAACHWCHVMERESFEDESIATLMNDFFVNIKVDREERPDIDHIYMDAVQAIAGNGGWPLNVFLTPDGKPFYGGTYFPPQKAFNRSSWSDVLHYIHDAWTNRRNEIEDQADKLLSHIKTTSNLFDQKSPKLLNSEEEVFNASFCKKICDQILKNADYEEGGFGNAPKFPQTFSIQFLLGYGCFYEDKMATQHALFSLKKMLNGGIYDHLGGGLARYSTDNQWLAPHFEKMLYDNALIINVLCDAYQLSGDNFFKHGIEKTIHFCLKELQHERGGFFAALDADSEGEEGKYYVWNKREIDEILGKDTRLFCDWYGITENGNWENTNILHSKQEKDVFASINGLSLDELSECLAVAEQKLLKEREKRSRPITDDKIILGWNALFATALCKAAIALDNDQYKSSAITLYEFLQQKFSMNGQVVHHTYKNGVAKHPAYLDDYAYLIQAAIYLQELTGNQQYLLDAQSITLYLMEHFVQIDTGFFYYTHKDQQDLILRKVEIYDSAIPSGNSIMAENLLYLSAIFDQKEWHQQANKMMVAMSPLLVKYPSSFGVWCFSILKQVQGVLEIVITGDNQEVLNSNISSLYLPNKILQRSNKFKAFPLFQHKEFQQGAMAYVCKNQACLPPVRNMDDFKELIKFG